MQPIRRAVIDVGTNSIKLLVADVAGRDVQPVHEESRQTRLGRGFYETRRLQMEPIAHSANAVADFARTARQHDARAIRVIATSAARDAVNPEDLISAIEAASKLKVEIISGRQEAAWAFQGVTTDPELARTPLLLLDVGGGSTEFILGQANARISRTASRSAPCGSWKNFRTATRPHAPNSPPAATGLKNFCTTKSGPGLSRRCNASPVPNPEKSSWSAPGARRAFSRGSN
jgi:exopolyphosphatase/guanosine-5'-triphosphate,3'-diphosphate pyrophosphatase